MSNTLPYYLLYLKGTGKADTFKERKSYLRHCATFARCPQAKIIEEALRASIGGDVPGEVGMDYGVEVLDYLRDRAYRQRVLRECAELVGNELLSRDDAEEFVEIVMANWDNRPLESHKEGLKSQKAAVLDLWAEFVSAPVPAEVRGLDDDTLVQIREATITLAGVKSIRDAEAEAEKAAEQLYHDIAADLKKRQEALFDQINVVAVMLWNARFPDHIIPEKAQLYVWSGHQNNGYATPPFKAHPSQKEWDRDPLTLCYSRDVWVNFDLLRELKKPSGVSAFKLTTSEGDGHHAFVLQHNGAWSFGHNANWARIAGGVKSIRELTEVLTKRLAAL